MTDSSATPQFVEGHALGDTKATAQARGYEYANYLGTFYSPPIMVTSDLAAAHYVIMTRELIIGYLLSPASGGSYFWLREEAVYQQIVSTATAEGVDVAVSPRKQTTYPWDAKPKTTAGVGKTVIGKGPKGTEKISLAVYLALLYQTYLTEHKYSVANQVLTELNFFQSGKVTEAQELDFLDKLPPTQ